MAASNVSIYLSIHRYIFIYGRLTLAEARLTKGAGEARIGLYTILLFPILYGVWHTQGGSGGGRVLPNHRAMVLQQCGQCRRAGRM